MVDFCFGLMMLLIIGLMMSVCQQDESATQCGNGKVLESGTFEFVNHNVAKMVDV